MSKSFRGTGTALVTPFTKSGQVDYTALKKLIDLQIAGGVEMLVPLGSTGENPTVTREERTELLRTVIEYTNHRALVIAGTGSNDTSVTVALTKEAEALGADAALVTTPYYNKPTPRGLNEHYQAVSDVGLPIVLYNVPSRTGLNMTAATTLQLAEIANIVAIKEASGDVPQCMEILHHAPNGFALLSGEDNLTLPLIALGAAGVVSVASNVVPDRFATMVRAALSGDVASARNQHYTLLDLMKVNFIESNPGPVKAALSMLGLIEESYRLPMIPVTPESRAKIRSVLDALGLKLVNA